MEPEFDEILDDAQRGPSFSFGQLFDFSFRQFVTPSLIRAFYQLYVILSTIGLVLYMIVTMMEFSERSGGESLFALVLGPVVWVVYLFLARIWAEFTLVVFDIKHLLNEQLDHVRGGAGGGAEGKRTTATVLASMAGMVHELKAIRASLEGGADS